MKLSASERLWRNVDKAGPVPPARPDLGPCWLWAGHVRDDGYAKIRLGGREDLDDYVHRVAYGQVPEGLEVDHLCKVRHCTNPQHLEAVTPEVHAARRRKPMCGKNLHPMSGPNLISRGRTRGCRECKRVRDRSRYQGARS